MSPSSRTALAAAVLLAVFSPYQTAAGPKREAGPAGPQVKLSADRLDFGTVKAGTTARGEIKIENQGDAPLTVTRIGVTCECAHLQVSTPTRLNVPIDRADEGRTDFTVAPGEAATLKLSVDTEKLANGPFEKRCVIVCSDRAKSPLSVPFALTVDRPPPPEPQKNKSDKADGADGKEDQELKDVGAKTQAPLVDAGPPPHIECDDYKVDFGEVYRGEKLFHTFKVKNTAQGELVIQEIRSTCTCAIAKFAIGDKTYDEEQLKERNEKHRIGALAPGEEAQLEVELKTAKATVPGRDIPLSKQIRVLSNDPQRASLALTLEAQMTSPFVIEPERFDFGVVRKGAGATMTAIIYSDKLGNFDIAAGKSPEDDYLKVDVSREPDDPKHPPAWKIVATVAKTTPLGNYNSKVELAVNHERVKEIVIPLSFSIEPNVTFTGNRKEGGSNLDFDVLNGQQDETRELTIENGDPSVPYIPKSITVEARPVSDSFQTELVEIEKGMKYVVKLTVPKSMSKSKFFQGDLVIAADHPDLPVKKVRFRGWFRLPPPPK